MRVFIPKQIMMGSTLLIYFSKSAFPDHCFAVPEGALFFLEEVEPMECQGKRMNYDCITTI